MSHRNATSRPGGRPDDARARRVLALLDGQEILGPGPEFAAQSSRQGERKFHVGNVAYSATESDLRELFESIGPVVECHIFKDSFDGRSRGFAVLRLCGNAFETRRGEVHGARIKSRRLGSGRSRMIYLKFYAGNLPYEIGDQELREVFESAGCEVLEAHVFFDDRGYSRGFGAARIAKANEAAALGLNEHEYRGRRLIVRDWSQSARFATAHWKTR